MDLGQPNHPMTWLDRDEIRLVSADAQKVHDDIVSGLLTVHLFLGSSDLSHAVSLGLMNVFLVPSSLLLSLVSRVVSQGDGDAVVLGELEGGDEPSGVCL
ncbi:hypothetical protein [Streptomyces sp. NPDC001415]